MPDLVRPADAADLPIMERLWQLFRHDLSEFTKLLPNPDGTFGGNRLHTAFTDADRAPYLLMSDDSPVGFVVVRGLLAPTRVLNAFFVVRGASRKDIGLQAVRDVTAKYLVHWLTAGRTSGGSWHGKTLIGRLFHVSYKVEGTWRLLKRHGWSWQQPTRRAIGRDDDTVEVWKKETWPRVRPPRRSAGPGSSSRTRPGSR
ncbi:winged helix-turn-helix domain-containing protein [Streptomyces sp. NPDC093675]|uniref:winged helix-turn-helix domain-containing protein n=1 Tax=Streptomyces sp. NPDC093675 TaxID=3366049 RepID=UPI003816CAAD